MKKNLYYHSVYGRENIIKKLIFKIFFPISIVFRVPLEIFIRKKMGHRYFSIPFTLIIAYGIFILPFYVVGRGSAFYQLEHIDELDWKEFLTYYLTWYVYFGFFLYFIYKRWLELKNGPSPFEGTRLTITSGSTEDYYAKFIPDKLLFNPRKCDIYGEPLPFFVLGLILIKLGQPIGFLLFLCSILYSLSYMGAYYNGDSSLMNMLDEEIFREHAESVFVDDEHNTNPYGIQIYMHRPNSEELRQKHAQMMFRDNNEDEPTLMK